MPDTIQWQGKNLYIFHEFLEMRQNIVDIIPIEHNKLSMSYRTNNKKAGI